MGGKQPRVAIDLNSADWHDGFETASAENCFNERHRIETLEAENTTLRERGDALADAVNQSFAVEDWPGGEPEAGERRLDARDGLRQAQANWREATGDDRDG